MQAMQSLTKGKLDPTRGIDIVKYATTLGNPTQPLYVEPWLRRLLDKRPPNFQNKLDAICTAGVNLKFFADLKVCSLTQDAVSPHDGSRHSHVYSVLRLDVRGRFRLLGPTSTVRARSPIAPCVRLGPTAPWRRPSTTQR